MKKTKNDKVVAKKKVAVKKAPAKKVAARSSSKASPKKKAVVKKAPVKKVVARSSVKATPKKKVAAKKSAVKKVAVKSPAKAAPKRKVVAKKVVAPVKKKAKVAAKIPVKVVAKKKIVAKKKSPKPEETVVDSFIIEPLIPIEEAKGEDQNFIPEAGDIKPSNPIQVHNFENVFHHREEVAMHQENKKVNDAKASRKSYKRTYRMNGNR
ncbi:MAG: hypothetical protein IPI10_09875 [Bacteroidetes bacterium]|nr:hypothetical protein [Bacteroidota bacterium]